MFGWILLAAVGAFLAVLLVRTLRFRRQTGLLLLRSRLNWMVIVWWTRLRGWFGAKL